MSEFNSAPAVILNPPELIRGLPGTPYATNTAAFAMPDTNGLVNVSVSAPEPFFVGGYYYIDDAGFFRCDAIDGTTMSLTVVDHPSNESLATVVQAGKKILPSIVPGVVGSGVADVSGFGVAQDGRQITLTWTDSVSAVTQYLIEAYIGTTADAPPANRTQVHSIPITPGETNSVDIVMPYPGFYFFRITAFLGEERSTGVESAWINYNGPTLPQEGDPTELDGFKTRVYFELQSTAGIEYLDLVADSSTGDQIVKRIESFSAGVNYVDLYPGPGSWSVKIRSVDNQNTASVWADLDPFLVSLNPVSTITSAYSLVNNEITFTITDPNVNQPHQGFWVTVFDDNGSFIVPRQWVQNDGSATYDVVARILKPGTYHITAWSVAYRDFANISAHHTVSRVITSGDVVLAAGGIDIQGSGTVSGSLVVSGTFESGNSTLNGILRYGVGAPAIGSGSITVNPDNALHSEISLGTADAYVVDVTSPSQDEGQFLVLDFRNSSAGLCQFTQGTGVKFAPFQLASGETKTMFLTRALNASTLGFVEIGGWKTGDS
jgi:uncharacterized protein GlcG (DUF336 family)